MQFVCTQRLYDPAVGNLAPGAVSDDAAEFGLEDPQAGNANLDRLHLVLGDADDVLARRVGQALEVEQGTDRRHVEPEFSRMANESQATDGLIIEQTAFACGAGRRSDQANALIVADGFDIHPGALGQSPDREHGGPVG